MHGKEFIEYLYKKYCDELEGSIIAVRKSLAELDPQSSQFVSLMQRQAKRELRHALAFTKALLQYPELDHHERAEVAEQAADEYRHYALIKDYLKQRGVDVEDVDFDAYDAYFDQFLTGDVSAFRLCNIAEKSAVVFMTHLSEVSKDPEVKRLAEAIIEDEEGHEDKVKEKLTRIAENPNQHEFIEKYFVQSWASQKEGVFREARELGVDVEKVVTEFRSRSKT